MLQCNAYIHAHATGLTLSSFEDVQEFLKKFPNLKVVGRNLGFFPGKAGG